MPRVFVVQDQHKWSEADKRFVPKFDLEPAKPFGDLVYLLSPTAAPFRPKPIIKELKHKLQSFTPDDHLLLIGNPVLIMIAGAIAADRTEGTVSVLQWSGKDQRYISVRVTDLFEFGDDAPELPPGKRVYMPDNL